MRPRTTAVPLTLLLAAGLVLPAAAPAAAAPPTATVDVLDRELTIGETTTVTVTFSEPVVGFDLVDLTVQHGIASGLSSSDGGLTWTANLTPTAGIDSVTGVITVDLAGVANLGGEVGTGDAVSAPYAVDTRRPTATVVVTDSDLTVGETTTLVVTFSERVLGFSAADLTVANATVSGLSSSDGGVTWTATLTPVDGIIDLSNLIDLDMTGVADAVGNSGAGTQSSNTYAVRTIPLTAEIALADPALAIGQTTVVTVSFSAAVSGLDSDDLTAEHATLGTPSSTDGGVTWSTTLTPDVDVESAGVVTLALADISSADGRPGSGTVSSAPYAVDTVRPTATLSLATSQVTGPTTLTIVFSEAVASLMLGDLVAAQGTLSDLTTVDGGRTWTATFTPDAGTTAGAATVGLQLAGVSDAAGNAGLGVALSAPFAIDTAAPVAPPAPDSPAPADEPVPTPVPGAGQQPGPAAAARPAQLAATGADPSGLLSTAVLLVAAGLGALSLSAARRVRVAPRTRRADR